MELAAVEGQIADLRAELEDYDALRSSGAEVGTLHSLDDLPRILIRSRIANGLSQKDLADRLGLPEQQVQRYEANDWSTASLERLTKVAHALGVQLSPAHASVLEGEFLQLMGSVTGLGAYTTGSARASVVRSGESIVVTVDGVEAAGRVLLTPAGKPSVRYLRSFRGDQASFEGVDDDRFALTPQARIPALFDKRALRAAAGGQALDEIVVDPSRKLRLNPLMDTLQVICRGDWLAVDGFVEVAGRVVIPVMPQATVVVTPFPDDPTDLSWDIDVAAADVETIRRSVRGAADDATRFQWRKLVRSQTLPEEVQFAIEDGLASG